MARAADRDAAKASGYFLYEAVDARQMETGPGRAAQIAKLVAPLRQRLLLSLEIPSRARLTAKSA